MKKISIAILTLIAVNSHTQAQSTDLFDAQMRVYRYALSNYDLQVASNALYNMIALKPEREDLKDSLALVYFAGERFSQAFLVSDEIVRKHPERLDMLEIVAVCKQNLGMVKEALADYEKLYASQKSLYHLYQVATLQYQLQRYGECIASLDMILGNPESAKQPVNISLPNSGGSQQISMKAAAHNVKGICALDLKQPDAAIDNFKKALELEPQFMLAKNNLELANKQSKPASTGAAPTKPAGTTATPAQPKPASAPK